MTLNFSDINHFRKLGVIAKQLVEGFITGLHKSPYHGFSVEFAEHKLYNYGDSTKNIDWKVYARTNRLYTKQYEEETNLRCHILLDNSSSMHYPLPGKDKIRFSVFAAAALAYLLTQQRDAVALSVFSNQIDLETELKSTPAHYQLLIKHLSALLDYKGEPKTTDIAQVLHQVAGKIHRRSLVVLFSDMFQQGDTDSIFNALQHLKHNKHEVIVFHISDHATELEFSFEDRPHKFIDVETKESITLNPFEIKDAYQQHQQEFFENIKIKCGMLKVDFVSVDAAGSFDKILGSYLMKRKKMR